MSFGINGPDHIPSIQKSHHANDGGAGNLGYFQQRKKKKNDDDEQDVFESSSKEDRSELLLEEMDSIGTRIKNFWHILKSGFNNTDENDVDEEVQTEETSLSIQSEEQKNPEE